LTYQTLRIERDDAVLIIGLNRPDKRNAFDLTMLGELAAVYGDYDADDTLRAAVLYGEGKHFTAGLDLASVAPEVVKGANLVPEGGIDPWQVHGRSLSKALIAAVHGRCLTLGIALMLSADIVVAAASTTFNQMEVVRGVVPWGGATIRFPRAAGWGNAMRWMLTAEDFDAEEARRIGIVQESPRMVRTLPGPPNLPARSPDRHRSRCEPPWPTLGWPAERAPRRPNTRSNRPSVTYWPATTPELASKRS
jgi:enoyl-CoA hydratase/carnithine racemase